MESTFSYSDTRWNYDRTGEYLVQEGDSTIFIELPRERWSEFIKSPEYMALETHGFDVHLEEKVWRDGM